MSQLTQHAGMYLGSQRPEERQKRYVPAVVHILDGQTDQIVQTLDNSMDSYDTSDDEQAVVSLFWNDEHKYTLKSGGHFDFKTTYNNSDPIQGRNRVVIPSEGGDFFHEFIIDETIKDKDVKEVYSTPSELDLKKMGVIDPGDLEDFTVAQAANYALGGTEWALGIVETSEVGRIGIQEYTDPYTLVKRIASTFDLEIRFRVEVQGSKIIGRYVDFLQKRGVWRGKEITLGKDLIGVKRTENTKGVVTALKVVGPVNRDDNGNESRNIIEVKDEEARQRWSRTGAHLWDVIKYENEDNPEYYTEARLRKWGEQNLDDRINAAVEYAADTVSLEHVFGLDHEVVRIGDTVRVKDTSYKPALHMEARIFEITRSLTDPSKKKYKLGDFIEYAAADIESLERRMLGKIARKIGLDTLAKYAEKKKIKGDTAPDDTEVIWVDTSVEPNVVRTYNGSEWVKATPTQASEVNAYDRSEVRQRIEDAENAMNTAAENYAMQYSETYYEDNITSAVQEAKTYSDEEIQAAKQDIQVEINSVTDSLTSKAEQEDVDDAVAGLVRVTDYEEDQAGVINRLEQNETSIEQKADEVDLSAAKTEYRQGLNQAETYTNEQIEALKIGGRNLIRDFGSDLWSLAENAEVQEAETLVLKADGADEKSNLSGEDVPCEPSTTYTISIEQGELELNERDEDGNYLRGIKSPISGSYTFTTSSDAYHLGVFTYNKEAGEFVFSKIKLEKGNKATDWTPAPEDMEERVSSAEANININAEEITQTVSLVQQLGDDLTEAETKITSNTDEIEIRATKTEVNDVEGRLSEAESTISAQADEIELKVNVDNVISRINLSDETVTIEGNRIEINGQTFIADAVITNAMINSLHGEKIQAETITSTALAVQYLSSITADLGVVNAGELNAVDIYGSTMTMANDDYETTIQDGNVRSTFYRSDGRMDRAMLEPGIMRLRNTDTDGNDMQRFIEIAPDRITSDGDLTIDADLELTGSIIYLGDGTRIDNSGGNVRLQTNSDNYLNYFFVSATQQEASLYLDETRQFRFINETGAGGGQILSFRDRALLKVATLHELQVRRADDEGYGDIVAADFAVGSDRNTKDHIQPWTKSVLDRIQDTNVYTYTLKGKQYESLPARYHLGLMHDEMPSIVQQSNETLNMYALVAYLWRGIQEEAEARQALEKRLEAFEDVS